MVLPWKLLIGASFFWAGFGLVVGYLLARR